MKICLKKTQNSSEHCIKLSTHTQLIQDKQYAIETGTGNRRPNEAQQQQQRRRQSEKKRQPNDLYNE